MLSKFSNGQPGKYALSHCLQSTRLKFHPVFCIDRLLNGKEVAIVFLEDMREVTVSRGKTAHKGVKSDTGNTTASIKDNGGANADSKKITRNKRK